jgi:hypothetical protein
MWLRWTVGDSLANAVELPTGAERIGAPFRPGRRHLIGHEIAAWLRTQELV